LNFSHATKERVGKHGGTKLSRFDQSLIIEEIASPILNEYYQKAFTNLIGIIDVSRDFDFQRIGVDKFLILKHFEIPKIIVYSIDEKVRDHPWDDIIVEIWSKREQETPGWVWTCKSDYIVYAYMDGKELAETPRFIPTVDFVEAIKTKNYPSNEAKNIGWTTVFKIIPKQELFPKPPKKIGLHEFMSFNENK